MASAEEEAVPALPPIKTAPLSPPPTEVTSASAAAEGREAPSTPTSDESRLGTPAECPPAPHKPAAAPRLRAKKRKSSSPSSGVFVAVPRDLSAVFRSLPPKKRIRVS
ncbi:hypothetical protein GUJ93_ZPchr0002g23316 [Zizania palustris]|uniref:Uncharacterized protein n=1 Tax=Zizania palustris TaxID=103762 RepID=A0A8J5RV21_ZIZPA|nr:hypothetical protein GUJ93_ZPchr0002g23316 [Zizania palustris]KAG8057268.1 hypothetical protein GUJ93_ZPchr0002g23316 [Zizania palustris]